jgi:tight adherence protein C
MIELAPFFVFALIAALVFLLAKKIRKLQRDPVRQRLAVASGLGAGSSQPSVVSPQLVDNISALLPSTTNRAELLKDLRRAGYYKPTAQKSYLAIRNSLAIASALLTAAALAVIGPGRQGQTIAIVLAGVVAAGLCWSVPRVYVSLAANRRAERIRHALPFALDMIGMCLTGGISLYNALAHVSREIYFAHPDLAVELRVIQQQTDMNSLQVAFTQFAERIDLPEITAFSALITQSQRLGTNVVDAVLDFADDMRLKRRLTADEQSAKAMLKLLFPVALCLLPSFFLLFLGPTMAELSNYLENNLQEVESVISELPLPNNQ